MLGACTIDFSISTCFIGMTCKYICAAKRIKETCGWWKRELIIEIQCGDLKTYLCFSCSLTSETSEGTHPAWFIYIRSSIHVNVIRTVLQCITYTVDVIDDSLYVGFWSSSLKKRIAFAKIQWLSLRHGNARGSIHSVHLAEPYHVLLWR